MRRFGFSPTSSLGNASLNSIQVNLTTITREVMMNGFNKNRLAFLLALIAMMLIAGGFGYRLQLGATGLTFERNMVQR